MSSPSFQWSARLLKPGLAVMQRLSFARKLLLMGLVLTLPLGWLMGYALLNLNSRLAGTQAERLGSEVVAATLAAGVLTQKHRGQLNLALAQAPEKNLLVVFQKTIPPPPALQCHYSQQQ